MTQSKQLTHVTAEGETSIVRFQAERINDFALARKLGEELMAAIKRPECRQIILDFDGLDYVVSEVFSVLLRLAHEAEQRGCRVKACNLSRFFREIYETMRFQHVVPTYETLEEALKA